MRSLQQAGGERAHFRLRCDLSGKTTRRVAADLSVLRGLGSPGGPQNELGSARLR
jgi:hypothetical protein